MAKGRPGHLLEAWKFSLYLGLPLLASWYYNDPERQKASADYWKYVEYPANPTTGMKERLMEQERLHREQQKQREVYQEQLRQLDQLASQKNDEEKTGGFWWRLWKKQS